MTGAAPFPTPVAGSVLAGALVLGAWAGAAFAQETYPEVTAQLISRSFSLGESRSRFITVNLDRVPERKAWVDWKLTHHGGADATDYSFFPSYFYFPPDRRVQVVLVTATDDDFDDDCESVEFSLVPRSPGVVGGGTLTISIRDDDGEAVECPVVGGDGPLSPLPPPEPEPEAELEPDPEPPPPQPPTAAFAVGGVACDEELCRVVTGAPVELDDTSSGTVVSRHWDFGDGNTSRSGAPEHAWSSPGFYEVTLVVSDGTSTSTARRMFLVTAAEPKGTCILDAETVCLQDSRYAVAVEWWNSDGESRAAGVVHQGTNDSGLFSFVDRDNWEVLVKVLDGCSYNGRDWVFLASATNLEYEVTVTDTANGETWKYWNEAGTSSPAATDTSAFPGNCDEEP